LTDEYQAVFVGLTQAEDVYGAIMYARNLDGGIDTKIAFYLFDGTEVYNTPIAACTFGVVKHKKPNMLHTKLRRGFMALCKSIATLGLTIYELRDQEYNIEEMIRGKYFGTRNIYMDGEKNR
jgi:hypothetical protein